MSRANHFLALGVLASAVLGLSGCAGWSNPCATVPPPSPAAVDLVRQGYEVEKVGRFGAECELSADGAWLEDAE